MPDLRMPDLNKVILAGRLLRDPEGKHLANGTYMCKLGIAASRTYKTNGEQREETLFINATCWGKTAEFAAHAFTKGRPVLIEGRLRMNEWEKDGEKRRSIEINADRVQSLSWDDARGTGPPQPDALKKQREAAARDEEEEQESIPF